MSNCYVLSVVCQVHIKNLETEKRNLEKCVREAEASVQSLRSELTEAQDKEKLMVAYPDLNQPVSHDLHGKYKLINTHIIHMHKSTHMDIYLHRHTFIDIYLHRHIPSNINTNDIF